VPAQLGFAFSLYSILAWTAIDLLRTPPAALPAGAKAAASALRPVSWTAAGLIFVTVASGAFVAGNDAGHAYNDWPLFAGRLIPEQIWEPLLGVRNFFENTATVQFDHRLLAYASLGAVGAIHAKAGRLGGHAALPPAVRSASRLLGLLVGAQVVLGVSTLMLYVPVSLGAAHQGGAMVLLTGAINLLHAISQAVKAPAAAAAGGVEAAAVKAAVRTPAAMAASAALVGLAGLLEGDGAYDGGHVGTGSGGEQ
jgi:heme a synthase